MGIGCRRRGDKVDGWRDRVQTHGAVNVCTADEWRDRVQAQWAVAGSTAAVLIGLDADGVSL